MKKRILTGITTTGTPHIGNYIGAIRQALEMAKDSSESFSFLQIIILLLKIIIQRILKIPLKI